MARELLAPDTTMGAVTLDVADLDSMTRYYGDAVGLDVLFGADASVTLGRAATAVVILRHAPRLRRAAPNEAGLFHTAILFDTQQALAAAVSSVARRHPGTFTGSADHLVSKAFYFDDPEGNGVELYWDRERTQWSWTHGQVEMATLYLDPNAFLSEYLAEDSDEDHHTARAVVGHVHLSVGDTATAREFYVDRLGFEATANLGRDALFVSAGRYHHHMAMNVWRSRGAGPRQPALGLGQVEIVVPDSDGVGALTERMKHYGLGPRDDGRTVTVDDPWANRVHVTAAA